MRQYEKFLRLEEKEKKRIEKAVSDDLSDGKPKSMKELFRVGKYSPGLIAEVVHSMYDRHILVRVKGDLKPFGCMVKPETLYKLNPKPPERLAETSVVCVGSDPGRVKQSEE